MTNTTTTLEETSNPETGLEAETARDQVRRVVGRLQADKAAKGEGETSPEPSTLPSGKDAFDQPVEVAQRSWFAGRDAKYRALFDAVPLVKLALDNPHAWDAYRTDKGSKARTIEAQVFDVIVSVDPEATEISSTRRAIYGNVIGYFAFECKGLSADEAIEALKGVGTMEKVAERYQVLHPAHFTTRGRKSRATGKRPGRPPGSGTRRKKTQGEPEAIAGMSGLDQDGKVIGLNHNAAAFQVSFSRGINGDRMKLPPITSREEAGRVYKAIQQRPLSEVDAFLAGEGLTPDPAEDSRPVFLPASDAARELPPTVKIGEEAAGDEGSVTELDHLRAECREAFETFMASNPNEGELCAFRDYLKPKIAAMRQAEAAD